MQPFRRPCRRERRVEVVGGQVEVVDDSQVEEGSWNLCVLLIP
jgi:hypothetical protein